MNRPWHLLVYIAADNTLYKDALVSLRQITDASLLASIKITVQFDGPGAKNSARYDCAEGKRRMIWAAPENYSADRAYRLRKFLEECGSRDHENQRVFLVLWGHGAGLDHVYLYNDATQNNQNAQTKPASNGNGHQAQEVHGNEAAEEAVQVPRTIPFDLLNPDNAHANRYLKDIQLAQILDEYSHRLGGKIDLLGFDACLMGLAEICHEVASAVSVIVGSDEELPKGSWPYNTILQDLTRFPGMDAGTLSAVIVSRFLEDYVREGRRTRISMSAYSLSACDSLATAVKGFVQEVNAQLDDPGVRSRILLARNSSRTPQVTDYVDLGVFCNEIVESFEPGSPLRHRAEEIQSILLRKPYIFYHREAAESGAAVSMGLAIYFPEALPPDAAHLETAVNAGRGFQTYQPLADNGNTHGHQVYRPSDADASSFSRPTITLPSSKTVTANPTKTVTANPTKTPPANPTKGEASGGSVTRKLIGSAILWDQYIRLRFNQETGWARLIEKLIDDHAEPANSPRQLEYEHHRY